MNKDDATWLKVGYVLAGLVVAYTMTKAMETIGIQTGAGVMYDWYAVASLVVSVLVAIASIWYLRKDADRNDYFLASIGEVRKVTWPSFIDTRRMTLVVCVVVGIFSVILGIFDYIWAEFLKMLLSN